MTVFSTDFLIQPVPRIPHAFSPATGLPRNLRPAMGAALPARMSIDQAKHEHVQRKLADQEALDPRVEAMVNDVIGRVADKWTMIVIDVLAEHGELRFSQVEQQVPGISQKMLAQTLRGMERDGLLTRTVFPEVPPRVQYRLTDLGLTLGEAFCGVWIWAEQNLEQIEQARHRFDRAKARRRTR